MRHAGPSRRDLGIPTAFNILGPLSNPGRAKRYLIGVADERMAEKMAGVLQADGALRALIVHGCDGLAALPTTGSSSALHLTYRASPTRAVEPPTLGIPRPTPADPVGGAAPP